MNRRIVAMTALIVLLSACSERSKVDDDVAQQGEKYWEQLQRVDKQLAHVEEQAKRIDRQQQQAELQLQRQ